MEEQQYDVAIWRYWPSTFPDQTAYIWAPDPLSAIVLLMQGYGLRKVAHATACLVRQGEMHMVVDGPIVAYNEIKLFDNGVKADRDTSWRRESLGPRK
ncbi:MAG TPA: hypothetical protein VGN34_27060 [Ktedonobacteraceae bacterium]